MEFILENNGIPKTAPEPKCAGCGANVSKGQKQTWTHGVSAQNSHLGPVIPSFHLTKCPKCETWNLGLLQLNGGGDFNVAVDYNPDAAPKWVKRLNKESQYA